MLYDEATLAETPAGSLVYVGNAEYAGVKAEIEEFGGLTGGVAAAIPPWPMDMASVVEAEGGLRLRVSRYTDRRAAGVQNALPRPKVRTLPR